MASSRILPMWPLSLFLLAAAPVGYLWHAQDSLIFPFRHANSPVAADAIWSMDSVEVEGQGRIAFLFGEPKEPGPVDAPVLLFLHGNGSSAALSASVCAPLLKAGVTVVAAEYPGYSGNPGQPGEASLGATAEAVARWARERWPDRRLAVMGESIGSWPASHLASSGMADLLVLDSPFTSMGDAIRHHMPWLPGVGLLNRHPMENLRLLRDSAHRVPTLVLLSQHDPVVPVRMGEEIARAIPDSRLYRSPQAGHPVLHMDWEAMVELARFLGVEAVR